MNIIKKSSDSVVVELNKEELLILNNALNEICNGSYAIDDVEFATLIGATKEEVMKLLDIVNKIK